MLNINPISDNLYDHVDTNFSRNESSPVNKCSNRINSNDLSVPIELDWIRAACHVFLVSTGLPLNLIIAVVIVAFKRLHNKPRLILWLGVTVCNLLTLLTILIEFLSYITESESLCLVFVSITGVAYTGLLFNLFLALMDRYAAIVHPLWHREKVTVKRVIMAQLLGFIVLIFIIKFPFLTGSILLHCGMCEVHGKIIAVTNMILLVMCIGAQLVVYKKTRKYFPKKQSNIGEVTVSFVQISKQRQFQQEGSSGTPRELSIHQEEAVAIMNFTSASTSDRSNTNDPQRGRKESSANANQEVAMMKRHGGNRRMEVEATWSLLAGVLSLLLFTFPTLLIGFVNWGCILIYANTECIYLGTLVYYARELLLGHLVYNPAMYMIRSHEFSTTVREKFPLSFQCVQHHHRRRSSKRVS